MLGRAANRPIKKVSRLSCLHHKVSPMPRGKKKKSVLDEERGGRKLKNLE